MKSFLSFLLIALSKSQDCSLDNIGLTSVEPRGLPDVPIENPDTEPFTTTSSVNSTTSTIYTSTEVPMETVDINNTNTTMVYTSTEVPMETVDVKSVSVYTSMEVPASTEVPMETVDVKSVSVYTSTEVQTSTSSEMPMETDAVTVTETVNEQQVTQSTCEYSMETIKTIVLKTIYVNTCVVDDEIKQLSAPINCTLESQQ